MALARLATQVMFHMQMLSFMFKSSVMDIYAGLKGNDIDIETKRLPPLLE